MRTKTITFLGGSQDGKTISVPLPVQEDMEFLVRPEAPYLPWEPYRLGEDGRLHYLGLNLIGQPHVPDAAAIALSEA